MVSLSCVSVHGVEPATVNKKHLRLSQGLTDVLKSAEALLAVSTWQSLGLLPTFIYTRFCSCRILDGWNWHHDEIYRPIPATRCWFDGTGARPVSSFPIPYFPAFGGVAICSDQKKRLALVILNFVHHLSCALWHMKMSTMPAKIS